MSADTGGSNVPGDLWTRDPHGRAVPDEIPATMSRMQIAAKLGIQALGEISEIIRYGPEDRIDLPGGGVRTDLNILTIWDRRTLR